MGGTEGIAWGWTSGGECPICGKPFDGLHMNSKKTCSSACRQKLQRYKDNLNKEPLIEMIEWYEMLLEIDELREKTLEQLKAAQAAIGELTAQNDS